MTDVKIDRPPAPEGSVYLQDVLDIVRVHAERNRWCDDAEGEVAKMMDTSPRDLFQSAYARQAYCCYPCNGGMHYDTWTKFVEEHPEAFIRFVLLKPDTTISVEMLAKVATSIAYEWQVEPRNMLGRLLNEIAEKYGFNVEFPALARVRF